MSQTTCGDYDSALTIGLDCYFDSGNASLVKVNLMATNETVGSLAYAIESICRKDGLVGWNDAQFDLVNFRVVAKEWILDSK